MASYSFHKYPCRYINKLSCRILCEQLCVDIPTAHKTLKCQHYMEAVEMAMMFPVASQLCMHACVRVKNDNHISGNAWPEQVVGLVKRVALC